MDGYKKFIMVGCGILIAGYFLPWITTLSQSMTGIAILDVGQTALNAMRDLGHYDYTILAGYAAVALPGAAAALTLLYCLLKPARNNGSIGTFLFLLPLLTIILVYTYLAAAQYGVAPGSIITSPLVSTIQDSALDLSQTAGLWLAHLGALLMALGRVSR